MFKKQPEWAQRHAEVILQQDNAPYHTAKLVKNTLKELNWETLSNPLYSPDLTTSYYYLFALIGHSNAEQYFVNFEEIEKWLIECFASKKKFFGMVSIICLEYGRNV